MNTPIQTRTRDIRRFTSFTVLSSGSIIFVRRTPNTGVIKLNIVTLETWLNLRSIPQRAYAIAERKER
jgi:hypothetical protein